MRANTCERRLLFFICVLMKGRQAFTHDARKILDFTDTAGNTSLNRARSGGPERSSQTGTSEQSPVGCRELRSTKYISDGQCTGLSPVKELVCAGDCLPVQTLPNWIGGGYGRKFWGRREAQEWRCVTDRSRHQRIQLRCPDGSERAYRITVVTSCRCKRYHRQHSGSGAGSDGTSQLKHEARSGRRPGNGAPEGDLDQTKPQN